MLWFPFPTGRPLAKVLSDPWLLFAAWHCSACQVGKVRMWSNLSHLFLKTTKQSRLQEATRHFFRSELPSFDLLCSFVIYLFFRSCWTTIYQSCHRTLSGCLMRTWCGLGQLCWSTVDPFVSQPLSLVILLGLRTTQQSHLTRKIHVFQLSEEHYITLNVPSRCDYWQIQPVRVPCGISHHATHYLSLHWWVMPHHAGVKRGLVSPLPWRSYMIIDVNTSVLYSWSSHVASRRSLASHHVSVPL